MVYFSNPEALLLFHMSFLVSNAFCYKIPAFFSVLSMFRKYPCRDEEWKTNLMSLAILFHLLCAQRVSDINIFIIRSLRLCCWITTSVVLFSVRCVLELLVRPHQKFQHTTNWEQNDRCGNSTTHSQAPDDGYINVRNMLSAK